MDILRAWDQYASAHREGRDRRANPSPKKASPLASVKLLAPLLYPGAFYVRQARSIGTISTELAAIAEAATRRGGRIMKPDGTVVLPEDCSGSIISDGAPARLPEFSEADGLGSRDQRRVIRTTPTRDISETGALSAVALGYRHRQRSVCARPDEARRLDLCLWLDRPGNASRTGRRWSHGSRLRLCLGPEQSRHQAVGEWRPRARFQHQQMVHSTAEQDRLAQPSHHLASGRT